MLIEVEGIVMRRLKYGEGSLISDILTVEHEIVTTITSGLNSKKGQHKSVLLQVGTPVNCILYFKEGRNMHRLKDVSSGFPLEHIPFSIEKGAVLLFMIELTRNALGKSGSEQSHYHFLLNELKSLDQKKNGLRFFPLQFTVKLSQILGFGPNLNTYTPPSHFDLLNGVFSEQIPTHPHYFNDKNTNEFYRFCSDIEEGKEIEVTIDKKVRKYLLDKMMDYFSLHIENFKKPNAQDILSAVFDT